MFKLTGWKGWFQGRGRVDRLEDLPWEGFHSNHFDSAHTFAQQCYEDIASKDKKKKEVSSEQQVM